MSESPGTPSAAGTASDAAPEPDGRVTERARELLPEEMASGSADPQAQAAAMLADSDERTDAPGSSPDTFTEHRTSEQAGD